MAIENYKGSCKCGRVRFEAGVDWSAGTMKCNCTSCWKTRWWTVRVNPKNFRAVSGAEELSGYVPGQEKGHSGFCKHCGVFPYAWVEATDWNPAEYVAVNVTALDELDPAVLVGAKVTYADGRNDNWWNPPAETRHL